MYFSKPQATTIKPLTNITENQTTIEPVPTVTATNVTDTNPITWSAINVTETNINVTTEPNIKETNVTLTVNTNLTAPNATFASKKRNLTRPDYVKEATQHDTSIEGVSESKIVTEKPLSLETQTFLQTRIPPNIESYRRVVDEGGMDTGAIAGISFAALVLAALAGSTAFVLYRRRYLNKPQTLNDKCSNPDSSGYLDDSTIRVCIICLRNTFITSSPTMASILLLLPNITYQLDQGLGSVS